MAGPRSQEPPDDEIFDLDGLARYSKLSLSTIGRSIRDHGLPIHRVGRRVLVYRREFDAWVRRREPEERAEPPAAPAAVDVSWVRRGR